MLAGGLSFLNSCGPGATAAAAGSNMIAITSTDAGPGPRPAKMAILVFVLVGLMQLTNGFQISAIIDNGSLKLRAPSKFHQTIDQVLYSPETRDFSSTHLTFFFC